MSPTSYSGSRRVSAEQQDINVVFKRQILREHSEVTRGFQVAVDLIKSNDNNAVLFAYLILKKAEVRLVGLRDDVAGNPQFK